MAYVEIVYGATSFRVSERNFNGYCNFNQRDVSTAGAVQFIHQRGAVAEPTPTQAPDFSISATPSSASVSRLGGTAWYTLTIVGTGGFGDPVSFAVSGLPAGSTASFSANPVLGATTTLAVATTSATPRGTYTLRISGTGGNPALVRTASVALSINKRR